MKSIEIIAPREVIKEFYLHPDFNQSFFLV